MQRCPRIEPPPLSSSCRDFLAFPFQMKLKVGILVRQLLLRPHTHTLASSDSLVLLLGWVPYTGGLAGGVDLLCLFLWQVCMLLKGRGTLLFCFSNAGQCDLLCSRCSNVSQQTIEHFPEYPRRIFDTGKGPVLNVKFEYFVNKMST